jgi:fermentation-respiration switch protein FrsA (DUF1100 family)
LASGKSPEEAEKDATREREVLDLLRTDKNDAMLEKDVRAKLGADTPEAKVGMSIKQLTSPWFRYFVSYDPAVALRKVQCPVLAIIGEKDVQVPAKQNLPAIRKALEEGGNKHFDAEELPGLNHLFQTAKTGGPGEYAQIEETISPVALEKMAGWILQQ